MNNVNAAMKNEIKSRVETIQGIRAQISGLKWKPEAREQVATIQAERRASEKPTVGKAELKAFRRPETGPQRAALWAEKREEGEKARYLLLAYGALRGRSYAQLEATCREDNKPSAYRIWDAIPDHVYPELSAAWTEKNIEAWLKGTPLPMPLPERVQAKSVQASAEMVTSL
jgi:hypothetical protein